MYKGDYINGEFVEVKRGEDQWSIVSPADLKDSIISVQSQYKNVDKACLAAKRAFRDWALKPIAERKEYLLRLKAVFLERAQEMAEIISRETGKPLWEGKQEAQALASKIDITLEHSLKLVADERITNALPGVDGVIRFKPRGVMAVVGPFNFPAHLPNGHIVPALITGNTIVFKPSDKTPATGQLLAEMIHQAGFPPGVFNLVQGRGELSRRLVVHEAVDGVLFTGSYEVGLKIKQDTLEHYWKLLALEMGGKNTTIVWQDADLEKAVYESLVGSFMTSGQRCSCTSKIILHRSIRDKFLSNFHDAAKKIKVGHWSEPVFMGPLINEDSLNKYLRFQEIAKREDCELLMRGKTIEASRLGYYVTPSITLVNKINMESVYQKTEIFGPNVAIYTVDEYDDAVNIVNASGYGLVAAVFTQEKNLYETLLVDARVGLLNWNRTTNGASSKMPFGGMGKSGNDRPSGHFAVQYCTVPISSLEDLTKFDNTKVAVGIDYKFN
jgi:succinylglutamic semialdehyde dehydrogenase